MPINLPQLINNAHACNQRGDYSHAARCCIQALQISPNVPETWFNLGIAYRGLGKRSEAIDALKKASALTLTSPEAQNSIGLQFVELDELAKAEGCLKQALTLAPQYAFAHSNLGILLEKQQRLKEAEAAIRNAIELQPGLGPAYVNLGSVLNKQKQHEAAETACRKAIELDSLSAEGWSNLGSALNGQGRYQEAVVACRKAVELNADLAEAWNNLGSALYRMKMYQEAISACRKAIELHAPSAETWSNLGNAFSVLEQYEAAIKSYETSLRLGIQSDFLFGNLVHAKMAICDWSSFAKDEALLRQQINAQERSITPFAIQSIAGNAETHCLAAKIWADSMYPEQELLGPIPARQKKEKIRIGYYSADFGNHPVSRLMVEVFETHNRGMFEIIGFSLLDRQADNRERIVSSFDTFVEAQNLSDQEIAELSRKFEIDIAIDLGGHTKHCRTGIFALRAAPIQASYLGYLGTMGAAYFEYLLADPTIIPDELQRHYTEKIIYLPSYQANPSKRHISESISSRSDLGLPSDKFIYCCFNNNYKITPVIFDSWMRILDRVEKAVLLLYADSEKVAENLRNETKRRGIDPQRILFGKRLPFPDYLARYRLADLFLDTLPYNAGTTASDALWAGLPVLTCIGEAFPNRMAASLLNSIGLPELITASLEEYEALAVELAVDPYRLSLIKNRLAENKDSHLLFNTSEFAKHLECAYTAAYERYLNGLAPDHIYV